MIFVVGLSIFYITPHTWFFHWFKFTLFFSTLLALPCTWLQYKSQVLNPNYSLEAKRANELVGFNPDLEKLE